LSDHNNEEWETEEVELEKPVSPVVSTRLSQELAERLFEMARRRRVPTSALVREALEDYLSGGAYAPATLDVTISSPDTAVTLYTGGRSGLGRTESIPAELLTPAGTS
jgi:hypothetical protein